MDAGKLGHGSAVVPSKELQNQIRSVVVDEMRNLEACLASELEGIGARLTRSQSKGSDLSEEAARESKLFEASSLKRKGLAVRRRRTIGADGADGLVEMIRSSLMLETVNDNDNEDNESSDDDDDDQEHDVMRKINSERRASGSGEPASGGDGVTRRLSAGRFLSSESAEDKDDDERPYAAHHNRRSLDLHDDARSDMSTPSCSSSTIWRKDALDFGDRLASTAAAKKGSASVESIIELVQTERERWNDEKQALEARLEELKAQMQQCTARQPLDPEKEALRQQVHELRQTMKLRSRFGAWVCERHMEESDDEEEEMRNADKEELRSEIQQLEGELRAERAKMTSTGQDSASSELEAPNR